MAMPIPILGFGQSSQGIMTAQPPFNPFSSNSLMAQPIPILDYGQPSQSSQTVAMSQPQSYFQSRLVGIYRGPSPISTTEVNNSETAGPISGYPGALNLGGNQPSHPTMMQQNHILPPNNENQRNLLNSQPVGRENQTPFLIGELSSHIDSLSQEQPALGQGMGWNHPSLGAFPSVYSGGGTIQMSVMPESSRLLASSSQSGGQAMRMEQLIEFHSCMQLPSLLPLQPSRRLQLQPVLPLQLPMHPELQEQLQPHYSLQPPTQPQFPLQPMQPLGPLMQPLRLLQPPMHLQRVTATAIALATTDAAAVILAALLAVIASLQPGSESDEQFAVSFFSTSTAMGWGNLSRYWIGYRCKFGSDGWGK